MLSSDVSNATLVLFTKWLFVQIHASFVNICLHAFNSSLEFIWSLVSTQKTHGKYNKKVRAYVFWSDQNLQYTEKTLKGFKLGCRNNLWYNASYCETICWDTQCSNCFSLFFGKFWYIFDICTIWVAMVVLRGSELIDSTFANIPESSIYFFFNCFFFI